MSAGVRRLADLASPQVPAGVLVLVPVGSIEQHGPHLPLDTDTVIAVAVAEAVAAACDFPVLVAPPLSYGSSGEHQSFAGTTSIGTDALAVVLVEITRSLTTWADRVVFVNAHGGNLAALTTAVARLVADGHDVAWIPGAAENADPHAGFTETSLMLHLRPGSVRSERLEVGNTAALRELLPAMVAGGVAAVSRNGVLGDPRGASAAEGERVLAQMVARALAALTALTALTTLTAVRR